MGSIGDFRVEVELGADHLRHTQPNAEDRRDNEDGHDWCDSTWRRAAQLRRYCQRNQEFYRWGDLGAGTGYCLCIGY